LSGIKLFGLNGHGFSDDNGGTLSWSVVTKQVVVSGIS
jgi:hypothetical protein